MAELAHRILKSVSPHVLGQVEPLSICCSVGKEILCGMEYVLVAKAQGDM